MQALDGVLDVRWIDIADGRSTDDRAVELVTVKRHAAAQVLDLDGMDALDA